MIIRTLKRDVIKQYPYELWNAFVNLLAMENYNDLDDVQKPAHLCFWYDSEVQNGGHLQYFENRGTDLLKETLQALHVINAECQRRVLDLASQRFFSHKRAKPKTAKQYVATALEGEFDEFDADYSQCTPEITDLLQNYLDRYQSHFVEIIE